MEVLLSVLGALGGVAGLISIFEVHLSIRNNQYLAIHEYLKGFEEPEFIAARSAVYNHNGDPRMDDENMAIVVNYFHHWGLLAKKRYLPLWVFDEGSGAGTMRLYENSKKYIEERRILHNDNTYASGFVWLYDTLKKRNK